MPDTDIERIERGVFRLGRVLVATSLGMTVNVPNQPYPLAMGEDGSLGFLYNGHIPSDLSVGQAVRMLGTLSEDEWVRIAANLALNNIRAIQANNPAGWASE